MKNLLKYLPLILAFIFGRVASEIISILGIYTGNKTISTILGLVIGYGLFLLFKAIYLKAINKNNKLDDFN